MRDSDATLVLVAGAPDGGTAKTIAFAVEMERPHQVVDLRHPPDPQAVADWLAQNAVTTLNVAGPRESKSPGIHAKARAYMARLIALLR